jgi:hypothetical protein
MYRTLIVVFTAALILTSSSSCGSPKATRTATSADIYIMRLGPRDLESNLAVIDDSRTVQLTVEFKAVQVTPDKVYYAVLASKAGDILGVEELVWQADELTAPAASETSARLIDEINKKRYKTVVFNLDYDRDDISKMVDAFNDYFVQLMSTVTFRQDASPQGYQMACGKYIDIRLLPGEEYDGLMVSQ